jgi:hypothetical protein
MASPLHPYRGAVPVCEPIIPELHRGLYEARQEQPDLAERFQDAATEVDTMLKGARPAALPAFSVIWRNFGRQRTQPLFNKHL